MVGGDTKNLKRMYLTVLEFMSDRRQFSVKLDRVIMMVLLLDYDNLRWRVT